MDKMEIHPIFQGSKAWEIREQLQTCLQYHVTNTHEIHPTTTTTSNNILCEKVVFFFGSILYYRLAALTEITTSLNGTSKIELPLCVTVIVERDSRGTGVYDCKGAEIKEHGGMQPHCEISRCLIKTVLFVKVTISHTLFNIYNLPYLSATLDIFMQ